VFYLPVRLNDQLFTNLTTDDDWKIGTIATHHLRWLISCSSFYLVYDIKVKGLKVLLNAVDPRSIDFLVLTSSMATVTGSPGETLIL
jgi:fatty acid synthase, animal type